MKLLKQGVESLFLTTVSREVYLSDELLIVLKGHRNRLSFRAIGQTVLMPFQMINGSSIYIRVPRPFASRFFESHWVGATPLWPTGWEGSLRCRDGRPLCECGLPLCNCYAGVCLRAWLMMHDAPPSMPELD